MATRPNFVDAIRAKQRGTFAGFALPGLYSRGPAGAPTEINVFVIGNRADGLFGAAVQGDVFAQVDAAEFRVLFGDGSTPQKFDRLRTMGQSYTVQEMRGAPNNDAPVFFKLLLRGGSQ